MKRTVLRAGLAALALVAALALAEVAVRAWFAEAGSQFEHEQYFEDADRRETDFQQAVARGDAVVGRLPRGRARWARPHTFYICYRKAQAKKDFDERGCVRVDINEFGIRDRAGLTTEKAEGERRILCLGDSFTFGWGVSDENTWVRRVESELDAGTAPGTSVRTVNCGAAGTLMIDEHWWGLRDRFHVLDPDAVLVTVCLNDLVPMPDTVGLFRTSVLRGCAEHGLRLRWECRGCEQQVRAERRWRARLETSRIAALLYGAHDLRTRLDLDPAVDWGRWLLEMPDDWPAPMDPEGKTFYERQGMPPEAAWKHGGPQAALRALRDWCAARGVAFAVVVWPLFQGLERLDRYPFTTLHRELAAFCATEDIACHDLLPVFLGSDSESWWVDPSDMHANVAAHQAASGPIAAFLRASWPELLAPR